MTDIQFDRQKNRVKRLPNPLSIAEKYVKPEQRATWIQKKSWSQMLWNGKHIVCHIYQQSHCVFIQTLSLKEDGKISLCVLASTRSKYKAKLIPRIENKYMFTLNKIKHIFIFYYFNVEHYTGDIIYRNQKLV